MSTNHYTFAQPSPMNLHSVNPNRPRTEFRPPPSASAACPVNTYNVFENRDKYMETQELIDERDHQSEINSYQNEVIDDEPCPPPDLKRLVTGQTVSFDDPNSPPFDRVVPGQVNSLSNQSTASISNLGLPERYVSGFPPVPTQVFSSNSRKENSYSNNNKDNTNLFECNNYISNSSQDFFDSFLGTSRQQEEKLQSRNVPTGAGVAFSVDNFQQDAFDCVIGKNANSAFQNYQNRPPQGVTSHHQRYITDALDNKSEDSRRCEESLPVRNQPLESFDTYSVSNPERIECHEKPIFTSSRNTCTDRRIDDPKLDILSENRMAVEGAPDNIQYSTPLPTSTPVQSPNYDQWYHPNSKNLSNDYAEATMVRNNDVRRDEENHFSQNPHQAYVPQCSSTHVFQNQYETNVHSKTPSISSNTSSANEISTYQQNDAVNTSTERVLPRMYDNRMTPIRSNEYDVKIINKEIADLKIDSHELSSESLKSGNFEHTDSKRISSNFIADPRMSHNVIQDTISSERRLLRKDERIDNQKIPDGDEKRNRGKVPGARCISNDGRSFSVTLTNSSVGSKFVNSNVIKGFDGEKEDNLYLENDEGLSSDQRTILGYNYNSSESRKILPDPPLETRMVVGETSSDAANVSAGVLIDRSRKERRFNDDNDRRVNKNRSDKMKKKCSRISVKSESEEDYAEIDESFDISPDRGSRHYGKSRYDHSRKLDKRAQRRDFGSGLTYNETFIDDEDDDEELFRKSYDRKYDRFVRSDHYGSRYGRMLDHSRREYTDREIYRGISRPSSRSGSECRPGPSEYFSRSVHSSRVPAYEFLNHRQLNLPKDQAKYFTGLREANPKEYMIWYKNAFPEEYCRWYTIYVQQKSCQSNRRGSGHSGPSSMNNDSFSLNEEKLSGKTGDSKAAILQEYRTTPVKFQVPHVKGFFNAWGQLLVVADSAPKEGQAAEVEFYKITPFNENQDIVQFLDFPGPFIVGETHVNTVSEFVKKLEFEASTISERLLYSLIDLIIKLRGVTDGIAISELLMNSYRDNAKHSDLMMQKEESKIVDHLPKMNEQEIIEKYTNLLMQGNKNAALDLAIQQKLWGHAFLLASKMGDKYYSNVLARFDSSIVANSPLKTLYQLYSNQIPLAATACCDEKWGDWRPHLAMILSNPLPDRGIDKTAIITLGDALSNKDVFASHFCYLAAEVTFEHPTKSSAKLSLLSLRSHVDRFDANISSRAILLTQAYEFGIRLLRRSFTISALMPFKYLLATRLIDYNECKVALQYLESIATDYLKSPDEENGNLMYKVAEIAERIQYADSKPLVVESSVGKPWLENLRRFLHQNDCIPTTLNIASGGEWSSVGGEFFTSTGGLQNNQQIPQITSPQQQSLQPPQAYQVGPTIENTQPLIFQPLQNVSLPSAVPAPAMSMEKSVCDVPSYHVPNLESVSQGFNQIGGMNESNYENQFSSQANDFMLSADNASDQQNYYSPWGQSQLTPQISMHPSSNNFYNDDSKPSMVGNTNAAATDDVIKPSQPATKENSGTSKDKKVENEGGSWLKRVWGLSSKKASQAHLPDDKDPPLFYDTVKGRWVDKEKKDEDEANNILPPPKASELIGFPANVDQRAQQQNMLTATSTNPVFGIQGIRSMPNTLTSSSNAGGNIYKKQAIKGMKANYVNVLAQSSNVVPSSNASMSRPAMDFYSAQSPSNVNSAVSSSGV